MTASTSVTTQNTIEHQIAARLSSAGIRLRFDKSAIRLIEGLKAALTPRLPAGHAVIITITAPIRRRAGTCAQIEAWIDRGLPDKDAHREIEGNQLRLRCVRKVGTHMPQVLVLVHHPEADTDYMLSIAEGQLLAPA